MNVTDVLRMWQDLACDSMARIWGREEIYGFFQRFRPNGDGLEKALSPLPQGGLILDRMLPTFSSTIEGWQNPESCERISWSVNRRTSAVRQLMLLC